MQLHLSRGIAWRRGLVNIYCFVCYIIEFDMGCCYTQTSHQLQYELSSLEKPQNKKVSTCHSEDYPTIRNKQSYSTNTHIEKEEEEELRQSPILLSNQMDLWGDQQQLKEEQEADLLRATHTNQIPINIQQVRRKKMENDALHTNQASLRSLNQENGVHRNQLPKMPRTLQNIAVPLSIIEQQSSVNNTNTIGKSCNQMSVSDNSQGGRRKMY